MNNKNYWISFYLFRAQSQLMQYALSLRKEGKNAT
jgi:hypothetical protein